MIVPDLLEKPIVLIDIGAVGNPPSHWLPLKDEIHLIGFEPNKDECRKLNESGCGYKKSEFLPYAIGECDEKRPFYITEYHECCSLLKPDLDWLYRFEYGPCFDLKKTIEVQTRALDSIDRVSNLQVNAIKIDAQGYELPILKGAQSILEQVFLVEIETGIHKNYFEESTFDEVSPHLRARGFMCMELYTQPAQKRKNSADKWALAKGQSMACESIWIRDLIKCNHDLLKRIDKNDFLSMLSLCWLFGYSDYGMELIDFEPLGSLLDQKTKVTLKEKDAWRITEQHEQATALTKAIGLFSHLLPTPARRNLYRHLPEFAEKPNLFKGLFRKDENSG